MSLPQSFAKDGFVGPASIRGGKLKRLLIGTDGWSDTGKTEFALSAPGPGIALCLDRGIEGVLDNATPPDTRQPDWAFKIIKVPLPTQMIQRDYLPYWTEFYTNYKAALDNPDCRTVLLDGDSDSWELQRLAEFGKLTQVPPIMYTNVNAARRAMIARAWDSGKIVIATNKLKDGYSAVRDAAGKETREKTGNDERQGFADQSYLWQVQLRHLYDKDKHEWGLRILSCKANTQLAGIELWGEDCNFKGLVSLIYPNIDLKEWGYK